MYIGLYENTKKITILFWVVFGDPTKQYQAIPINTNHFLVLCFFLHREYTDAIFLSIEETIYKYRHLSS